MKSLDGHWRGTIEIPNQPLLIIVKFEGKNGELSIPIQGLNNCPFSMVKVDDSRIFFEIDIYV